MKILFLASNPVDVPSRLRSEVELREVRHEISKGTHRDDLELVFVPAARADDLLIALLEHRPDIVHFSGHCNKAGAIILEDDNGYCKPVSREAIYELFSALKDNIRVVVLNACYAKDQAEALSEIIDITIGVSNTIEDRAAIMFSSQFYRTLSFGRSVEEAFNVAMARLRMEDIDAAHRPELLEREGVSAAETRILEPSHQLVPGNIPGDPYDTEIISLVAEKEESSPVAFLPWLFASIALILTTDVLRRFLGEDGSWWDTAAVVAQSVLITAAILAAALAAASLFGLANPLVEKAAGWTLFNRPKKTRKGIFLTLITLIVASGLWLLLPVFARYYNEKGFDSQYGEPPDLSRAREYYQLALRLEPSYAQAHYNLATVYEDFQPGKAMEEYLLAIRHDSRIYPAYNNLARLYLRRGKDNDYESALNILSQASDLAPQDEKVQYSLNKNLGWAHYALKNYEVAEIYLRRAISHGGQQGGAAAHCLLAYVLKEQGKAGVVDECYDCVTLVPGEKDLEAKWLSDAKDCLMKRSVK